MTFVEKSQKYSVSKLFASTICSIVTCSSCHLKLKQKGFRYGVIEQICAINTRFRLRQDLEHAVNYMLTSDEDRVFLIY